ncbi:MAG TPA: glycoside hydrolase family 9 protein [Candidatus Dormibacteraeota bacterium]|nr:glycoside hydrolase family 9 protein [Candidatus Dormibacteraeota bacterium]
MNRRTFLTMAAVFGGATAMPSALALASRFSASDAPTDTSPIVFDQLGYLPNATKLITLRAPSATFTVRTVGGTVVLQGKPRVARDDAASGDRVQIADISSLNKPGMYALETDAGKSAPFEIGNDVYRHALWLCMRGYSGQRCGCNVDLGDGYSHPACHLAAEFHTTSGKTGPYKNHGGWHDAGDYGRYVVNSGISTGTLLWTWELSNAAVRKLDLKIPESGGKIPDFLAEIKWNLDWMLTLQDADGGVWHKQASENFCAFVMPQDDHMISYVIGTGVAPYKSTGATADLAAVAAIAARCYGPYDDAYAKKCADAAKRAFTWAGKNPNAIFTNPKGIRTGEYGDGDCRDELLWAAAELWRTTGDDQYRTAFESGLAYLQNEKGLRVSTPGWGDLPALALWTYALADRKTASSELLSKIREGSAQGAEQLVSNSRENGYGNTMALTDYDWGSNAVAANQSLHLIVTDRLQKNDEFRQAAAENLHYLLGRNCWDLSWVTQLGRNPFQHPHHRPSGADNIAAPWPGLLSGGPNAHPSDPPGRLMPQRPPMRMYKDDQAAYSMNEICINWNAPLVFLLAALNEQ